MKQREAWCCKAFERESWVDQRCVAAWVMESWVRSMMMRLCRTSGSSRLKLIQIQEIRVSQPEVRMYRKSMPGAAGAKARKVTYHSHTAASEQRDDCSMVGQTVPGSALAISTVNPAFRFVGVCPRRTIDGQTQRRAGSRRQRTVKSLESAAQKSRW